jgi:hypothetical protein
MLNTKESAGSPGPFSRKGLKKAEAHVGAILHRARAAHEAGEPKLFRRWTIQYLQSADAKALATMSAYRAMPYRRRPSPKKLPAIVASLKPWAGTNEAAIVCMKKKPNGYYRLFMDFGIENRALQYLLLPLLKIGADLHPHQSATRGGCLRRSTT